MGWGSDRGGDVRDDGTGEMARPGQPLCALSHSLEC